MHGEMMRAWLNLVDVLRDVRLGTGERVYSESLNVKTVRERFTKYMKIVKDYNLVALYGRNYGKITVYA
jgi:hypothetical protein